VKFVRGPEGGLRCGCRISHCDPGGDGRIPEIEARVQPVVRNLHTDGTLTARVDHRFRLDHEENAPLKSNVPLAFPAKFRTPSRVPQAADACQPGQPSPVGAKATRASADPQPTDTTGVPNISPEVEVCVSDAGFHIAPARGEALGSDRL